MGVDFLRLRESGWPLPFALVSAVRIARWTRDRRTDVIHVFYRQRNVPLVIFLGLCLWLFASPARLVVDHRSVNLTRGRKAVVKKAMNMVMQPFVHQLVGNPLAVETNHPWVFRPKDIVDLGYDQLPEGEATEASDPTIKRLWFIGSLKPRNRKSELLIDVFDQIQDRLGANASVEIHVAGPARPDQIEALQKNSLVLYHGVLERSHLYAKLRAMPGIGIAYMNQEFHGAAPSLKFVEYAIMQFGIVASDTVGLRTQANRLGLPDATFVAEDPNLWADALVTALQDWQGLAPPWTSAPLWSYEAIFARQVVPLYARLKS